MGAILGKFKKSKSTYEILENLEKNIKTIEAYTLTTQEKQKRYVGNFLVISIGLYLVGFLVFYFAFFPSTWMERITYSVPLLIFPLLIFVIKRIVSWYFQRKLNKKTKELDKLKSEKNKIIEEVKEREPYKVAIEILNKFVDKNSAIKPAAASLIRNSPNKTPQIQQMNQQRFITPIRTTQNFQPHQILTPIPPRNTNILTGISNNRETPTLGNLLAQQHKRKTPFPIIDPKQRGVLEKIVDYLIGDGPQNRFAMICKDCCAHNGMALEEEFEYTAFRCAFCNSLNPSRKSKPSAPILQIPSTIITSPTSKDSDSSSETLSENEIDSENENVQNDNIENIDVENINSDEIKNVEFEEEEETLTNGMEIRKRIITNNEEVNNEINETATENQTKGVNSEKENNSNDEKKIDILKKID